MIEQMGMSESAVQEYVVSMDDGKLEEFIGQMIAEQVKSQFAVGVQQQLGEMSTAQLAAALEQTMGAYTAEQCALYYDEVLHFSESTYENNLRELGYVDIDKPATINLYASTFEDKDIIEDTIADYNKTVDELSQIQYTDYVGLMMSSVTSIINAITYVLIAFVAVSLIVS